MRETFAINTDLCQRPRVVVMLGEVLNNAREVFSQMNAAIHSFIHLFNSVAGL